MARPKKTPAQTQEQTPPPPPEKVLFQVCYSKDDELFHRVKGTFENLEDAKEAAIAVVADDAEARVSESFVIRVEAAYRRRVDITKVL